MADQDSTPGPEEEQAAPSGCPVQAVIDLTKRALLNLKSLFRPAP